jgi:hypothetical protein
MATSPSSTSVRPVSFAIAAAREPARVVDAVAAHQANA